MVRIIADSACDMTRGEAEELQVTLLPVTVTFGDREYTDGVDLSPREFYEKLIESDELPHTSQITPYTYGQVFREAVEAGDEAVCVVIGSKFSGSYQNALAAAEEFGDKVAVADTQNVSMGELVLVKLALRLRERGLNAAQIGAALNEQAKNVHVLALLDTLEYLKKGGRISPAVAFAGEMLSIKPVVSVVDGEVVLVGKARGSKNGNNLLRKLMEKTGGVNFDMPVAIGYTGLSDDILRKYMADNADIYAGRQLPVSAIGAAIGTHVGPNCVCVAFF